MNCLDASTHTIRLGKETLPAVRRDPSHNWNFSAGSPSLPRIVGHSHADPRDFPSFLLASGWGLCDSLPITQGLCKPLPKTSRPKNSHKNTDQKIKFPAHQSTHHFKLPPHARYSNHTLLFAVFDRVSRATDVGAGRESACLNLVSTFHHC